MKNLLHPAWSLALPLIAATALIASPADRRLYTVLVAAFVFTLLQWVVPNARLRTDHFFSPVNIATGLFLVKLLVAPILMMATGADNELFIGTPSRTAMEASVAIDTIACIGLALGLAFAGRPNAKPALTAAPGPLAILIFTGLGLVGFVLAFGSPSRLVDYFLEPNTVVDVTHELEGSLAGFLGVVLRPFLAFALVAWWARSADQGRWPALKGIVAGIFITLANMTFSFNRAAFVFPLVALVAAYSARVRRISPFAMTAALAIVIPALFALGAYRAKALAPPTAPQKDGTIQASLRDASDAIQAYAGGPGLVGLFLRSEDWGSHPRMGATLVASALSPVPVLGKAFRESGGSQIYNRALYGISGIEDQIIPFAAELFANFHAAGVLAGFFLLGQVLGRAHLWLDAAGSAFGAFVLQYVFMWCATLTVWSVAIVSQIAIYFLAPVYLYLAAMEAQSWLRGMRVPRLAGSY